jgi:hypothetical protein
MCFLRKEKHNAVLFLYNTCGMKPFWKIMGILIVLVGHKCVGTYVMDAEQTFFVKSC